MLGFKRGGVGYVLIRTTATHDNVTDFKGLNGKAIEVDVTYNPKERARIHGNVIQTPVEMGMVPIQQTSPGWPGYGVIRKIKDHDMDSPMAALYSKGANMNYKFMQDIVDDVRLTDTIYFKFRVLSNLNNRIAKAPDDSEFIYRVAYDQIYCIVREGNIIPVGGNVFIDPELDTLNSIQVPTYYPHLNEKGERVARPKDQWIWRKEFPEMVDRIGTVTHIGPPLKGDTCSIKVGMKVLYKTRLKSLHKVEGTKYIIIPQNQILAKLKSTI